jgi:heat shock protein HslJ
MSTQPPASSPPPAPEGPSPKSGASTGLIVGGIAVVLLILFFIVRPGSVPPATPTAIPASATAVPASATPKPTRAAPTATSPKPTDTGAPARPTATQVPASTATPVNPLVGNTYAIDEINGQPVLSGTTLSLEFLADGTLKGSSGCNSFTGSYVSTPQTGSTGSLTMSPATSTQAVCDPDVMQQEQEFMLAVTQVRSYEEPSRGPLSLMDSVGTVILSGS